MPSPVWGVGIKPTVKLGEPWDQDGLPDSLFSPGPAPEVGRRNGGPGRAGVVAVPSPRTGLRTGVGMDWVGTRDPTAPRASPWALFRRPARGLGLPSHAEPCSERRAGLKGLQPAHAGDRTVAQGESSSPGTAAPPPPPSPPTPLSGGGGAAPAEGSGGESWGLLSQGSLLPALRRAGRSPWATVRSPAFAGCKKDARGASGKRRDMAFGHRPTRLRSRGQPQRGKVSGRKSQVKPGYAW